MKTFGDYEEKFKNRFHKIEEEKIFVEKLKSSKINIQFLDGDFKDGIQVYTPDYFIMDNFHFVKTDYERQDIYCGPHDPSEISNEKFSYQILFFSKISSFGDKNVFYLDDKEMKNKKMNILYSRYGSRERGESLSFPVEFEEMQKFFLSKKMKKNLVDKLIETVNIIRGVLL